MAILGNPGACVKRYFPLAGPLTSPFTYPLHFPHTECLAPSFYGNKTISYLRALDSYLRTFGEITISTDLNQSGFSGSHFPHT